MCHRGERCHYLRGRWRGGEGGGGGGGEGERGRGGERFGCEGTGIAIVTLQAAAR